MSGVINSLNMPVQMPSASPSIGDVLTADTTSSAIWQAPSGGGYNPTSFIIPWTSWAYFTLTGGGGDYYWAGVTSQNGSPFTGPSQQDFGTVDFTPPVTGTYQFTASFRIYNGSGIATFVINGITTAIDNYLASGGPAGLSYVWTQSLTGGVTYPIGLSNFTKNVASLDYWILPLQIGLSIQML